MRNSAIFALLGALCAQGCLAGEASGPTISVLVYDYAGGSADTLNAGLRAAQRILKSGGVEVEWVHCPVAPELLALERQCRDARGPLTLELHILPPGATRHQTEPGAAGFAVPPADGGFGTFAGVFYDRVKRLGASINEAAALGHVIAHELGHLLLGTGQHSAGGIMQGNWRYQQIVSAAQGLLRFDRGERLRILGNMRRRMLAVDARRPECGHGHRD